MSRSKIKGQGHRDKKNEKVRHFVQELCSGARSSCGIFFQEPSSGVGGFYAGGKISACCLVNNCQLL